MRLEALELRRLRMPLVTPFRTAAGEQRDRDVLVVRAITDAGEGWGECVAMNEPTYTAEYTEAARAVTREHLGPRLLAAPDVTGAGVGPLLAAVQGHRMAKAALELAVLDAELRAAGVPLAGHLGAVRSSVDAGVSVGLAATTAELVAEVERYVAEGYRRVKLKIEPGADLVPARAVRQAIGPGVPLQVDGNGSYTVADADHLAQLDELGLLLVEQPLPADDLVGHAELARRLRTPVCLDESIESTGDALSALALGACSIVNVKAGRVGGYLEAKRLHDACLAAGVPVWCGGMLETGIGRAANLALAALPGFTLPADLSASDRYFHLDITPPFVLDDGQIAVPTGPGIGVDPDPTALRQLTTSVETLRR